jgi:hypothetical protein
MGRYNPTILFGDDLVPLAEQLARQYFQMLETVETEQSKYFSLHTDRIAAYDDEQALYDADPYDADTNPGGHKFAYGTPGLVDVDEKVAATFYPGEQVEAAELQQYAAVVGVLKTALEGVDTTNLLKFK